ncbi:MAG: DNA polymerase I [Proteobacteria bacterium]|nr:DNA polymerase I [Pseudomonadota bacterium]
MTLIDGNSLVFRAFFGLHQRLTRRDGTPVNAVYGFCNMILPLLAAADPDDIFICVFDAHRKNWRNDIYPEYKGNRPDTPPDLVAQIPLVRRVAESFGMPVMVIDDMEADDVIATLANHECALGRKTRIVTSDKDLMQLVSHCAFLYDGMKEKEIHAPEVLEKFGVRPDQVIDAQSLIGDSVDNVPGVPGIGPKTAAELINQFGSLDELYKNLDAVKSDRIRNSLAANKEMAMISRRLVTLKTDVKLPKFSAEPFRFDTQRALEFVARELESPALENKIKRLFGGESRLPPVGGESARSAGGGASPEKLSKNFNSNNLFEEAPPRRPTADTPPLRGGDATPHKKTFKIIYSESDLDEFLATTGDVLAIDTETTGLNHMTSKLVGISMATADNHGVYIPIRHAEKTNELFDDAVGARRDAPLQQMSIDEVKRKLWPVLKNHRVVKVGHNLKYDLHILENEGWATSEIAPIDDTMLLSYALYGTAHGHGLDELAKIYLDRDNIEFDSLFPPRTKSDDKDFAKVDIEKGAEYSAEDSYVAFALHKLFREKLDADAKLKKLYEECDRPLLRILMRMERDGVLVDQRRLKNLSEIFHEQLNELQKKIWHIAGREFNIASPKQLGELLFDELKLPGGGKSKSTDASTLAEIADAHPIISKILEWRSLSKLAGTYTDALPKQIGADRRIHTTYLQTSTNTGRLSSRDPNLQNIPIKTDLGKSIRKCFVADAGNVLISADYSQIQLRLLAHVADVAELKRAFNNGEDIHETTARRVFGISPSHPVPRDLRAKAKTVNFSIIYGVSPFGLSQQLDIPHAEAKSIIDSYMAGFPEIKEYMERVKEFVMENGYVLTPWGRRVELPDIKNPRTRAYALRAAINAPIQGFEADLMRLAMVNISEKLKSDSAAGSAKMIMQVHDELVFECPEHHAAHAAKIIESEMENVAKLSVPIIADTHIAPDWEK